MKRIIFILLLIFLLTGCTLNVTVQPLQTSEATQPEAATVPETTMASTETLPPMTEATEPVYLFPYYLQAKLGEFFTVDQEGYARDDPEGMNFGFPDNFWSGCTVWCAVTSTESGVWASSILPPIGEYTYEPANLVDRSRNTVWSEGAPGYGIGETVNLSFRYNWDNPGEHQKFDYRTLCIVNGYAQNERKWRENSRVRAMEVYVNGQYLMHLQLADSDRPQYFDISPLGISSCAGEEIIFQFRITEVYPGEKYDDTCLTGIEVEFWTPNH